MKNVAVAVVVIGAMTLIFGISTLIVIRLPYYRDSVRRQGNPETARRSGLMAISVGSALTIAGIVLAISAS